MTLSRRRFLTVAGGAAAGGALAGTLAWPRLLEAAVAGGRDRPDGRLLLVLELSGGNDGLNTLVPTSGAYRDARPRLAVPEGRVLPLTGHDGHGLHPALAPLLPRWDAGAMAAVAGIGLEGQSRSHFQATDTWSRGTAQRVTTGWLGRWLDATGSGPTDPLRAVALGGRTTSLAAERSLATHVLAPEAFRLATLAGTDEATLTRALIATAEPLAADPLVAQVQAATPAALDAVALLTEVSGGDADDPLAAVGRGRRTAGAATALLDVAAEIAALGVGTEVLVVTVGGFDTHADQAARQAALLEDLATGIDRFLAAMDRAGRGDDVLVVTTSEFGRRVAENASGGTDHGYGSVALALGPGVRGGVVGTTDLGGLVSGDLPVTVDTRSLYAAALDWLGGPTDEVLDGSFDRLGLLR